MKKILLIGLLIGLTNTIFAQNDVKARIEFEEAEKSFSVNDYTASLQRLNNAEKLLGKTNTKILYLKILNQNQIILARPYDDFTIINKLRTECDEYLKLIENKSELYDKYKEVYIIFESLKSLPTDLNEWNEEKENISIESKPLEGRNKIAKKILSEAVNSVAPQEVMSLIKDVKIISTVTVNGEKIDVVQKYILPDYYLEKLSLNGMDFQSKVLKNKKLTVTELGKNPRVGTIKELDQILQTASFFTENYILNNDKYVIYAKNNSVLDGIKMQIIEIINPDNTKDVFTYNSETKLLHSVSTASSSSRYLEYKDFSGVKIPLRLIQKEGEIEYNMEVISVEFNTDIKISEFK